MDDYEPARAEVLTALTQIVSAHLGNANTTLNTQGVSSLIREVHETLSSLASIVSDEGEAAQRQEAAPNPVPAVPVEQSVFPDHLVCLEDGRKFKTLKRHLQVNYGMTPREYRRKWGLPGDYPVVAPDYAAQRQDIARQIGLGRKKTQPVATETSNAEKAKTKPGRRVSASRVPPASGVKNRTTKKPSTRSGG